MKVPVVFAKKNKSGNISDDVYHSKVTSFTKKNVYDAVVSKEFLSDKDNVLYGFKNGPSGLLEDDYLIFDDAYIDMYRNTGAILQFVKRTLYSLPSAA